MGLARNFFWQQTNLWPDDLKKVTSLIVLSGKDRLIGTHCIRKVFEAEIERRRLVREAERSGGNVVIQRELAPAVPAKQDLKAAPAKQDLEAELRVCFFPEAIHGEFWGDEE